MDRMEVTIRTDKQFTDLKPYISDFLKEKTGT